MSRSVPKFGSEPERVFRQHYALDNGGFLHHVARPMVSASQQFERIRKRKKTTSGKRNKRERRALGTPKFPVHVAGYDAKAADAKK